MNTPENLQAIEDMQLKQMEYQINNNPETPMAVPIFNNLLRKDYDTATEQLADAAKKKYKFYTTRVDEKSEIWVYKDGIYEPNGRSTIREFCRKVLVLKYSEYIVNRVINKIETDTFIDQDIFFNSNEKDEIAVKNGILNVVTGELTDFHPTKIFFNKINAIYDKTKECNKIDTFFHEVLPDTKDVQTLYEVFGFCLYKEYFLEKAIMMLGSGRNGKGKTLNILKHFLGASNVTGMSLQNIENGEFKECGLLNRLANIGGDISDYPLKETNKFKGLTGRDVISASRKFKTDVSFVNYAKLIFSTNKLPKTYDLTTGFFDRWVFLTFPYTFKEKHEYEELMTTLPAEEKEFYKIMDPNRIEGILDDDEMSGLLNKALEGLQRLFNNNTFTSSTNGEKTKQFWIQNSDSFLAFALENIERDIDGVIEKETLRKRYQRFCQKNKVMSEGNKHIKEVLIRHFTAGEERKGFGQAEQKWSWVGIRFKGPIKKPFSE